MSFSRARLNPHLILPPELQEGVEISGFFPSDLFVGDSWGQSPVFVILQQLHCFLQAALQEKQQQGIKDPE